MLSLFPTRIHFSPLKGASRLCPALERECDAFRLLDDEGRRWSKKNYLGGYTSYGSLTDLPERSPTFAKLRGQIDREVGRFAQLLQMDLRKGKLQMTSCWINMMGEGTHHSFHLHPLSTISGTFYVRVPKDSGSFKLEDPRLPMFMASPPRVPNARPENQRFIELRPRSGYLVLFESWLKHEVPANRSQEERISISFNYDWIQ